MRCLLALMIECPLPLQGHCRSTSLPECRQRDSLPWNLQRPSVSVRQCNAEEAIATAVTASNPLAPFATIVHLHEASASLKQTQQLAKDGIDLRLPWGLSIEIITLLPLISATSKTLQTKPILKLHTVCSGIFGLVQRNLFTTCCSGRLRQ